MLIYFSNNASHGILGKQIYHPRGGTHAAADAERMRSRLSKRRPCPSVQMIRDAKNAKENAKNAKNLTAFASLASKAFAIFASESSVALRETVFYRIVSR